MLEADIQINKNLAVKGFRRALRYKALRDISYFYASRLFVLLVVVVIANGLADKFGFINLHLTFIILWVIATIHGYIKWSKELARTMTGWDFHAVLNYSGVKTKVISENKYKQIISESNYKWSFYKDYQEYKDYLQINDIEGGVTFLRKTSELGEIIEFTKSNIQKK